MQQDDTARAGARTITTRAGAIAVAVALVLAACTGTPQGDPEDTVGPSASSSATTGAGSGSTSGSAQGTVPDPAPSLPTEPADPAATPEAIGAVERKTADAVPLDEEVRVAKGVTARIVSVEPVAGKATLPGEVSGDALRVTVEITNDRKEDLDLGSSVVNLFFGKDRTPATTLSGPGEQPFAASVAAGKSAAGTFVFRVSEHDVPVQIEIDLAADLTVAAFAGDA